MITENWFFMAAKKSLNHDCAGKGENDGCEGTDGREVHQSTCFRLGCEGGVLHKGFKGEVYHEINYNFICSHCKCPVYCMRTFNRELVFFSARRQSVATV